MDINIRGEKWQLVRSRSITHDGKPSDGLCEMSRKKIRVHQSLEGLRELEVILHELTHACQWDLDEDAVVDISESIAGVLWRMGYRI